MQTKPKVGKEDIKMLNNAFNLYENHLWDMANASFLGGNVPLEWMPKYNRFKILRKEVMEVVEHNEESR